MNSFFVMISQWLGLGGALSNKRGQQVTGPSAAVVDDQITNGVDSALQIATVWRCVELLSKIISTLPFFAYRNLGGGQRDLDRTARLYAILHEQPNPVMTPAEFWAAMIVNWLLHGNAYAKLARDESTGEVYAMYPLPSSQVIPYLMEDGELVYVYQVDGAQVLLAASDVLHLKDFGNGITGLSRINFMGAAVTEAVRAQAQATRTFRNGDKPSGLLYVDKVLTPQQREALRKNFQEISEGPNARLFVLEAAMKYEAVSLTPAQVELLSTRQYGVEELCRWFGVPPVLVGHSNVTAWGTGIEQIIDGFYKLTVRPALVQVEQAVRARVMTPAQRARFTVEFSFDALLRSSAKDRYDLYAKGVQNGLVTRNECRQLENLPPVVGGDQLTAQVNLVPLQMLGRVKNPGVSDVSEDAVSQ
jgi:HK97 family phage portal protein